MTRDDLATENWQLTPDGWVRTNQLGEYLTAKAVLDMVTHP